MRLFVALTILVALPIWSANAQVIERANQRDYQRIDRETTVTQPGRGGVFVDKLTGVPIRRITSLDEYKVTLPNQAQYSTASPNYGATNGYSRFECFHDGWILAFGTTPYAILHAGLEPVRVLTSRITSSKKVGDQDELKWNHATGWMYYVAGRSLYRQLPTEPTSEIKVMDFAGAGRRFRHTSDGSFDADGRYLAMAVSDSAKGIRDGFVVVMDIDTLTTVSKIFYPSPNGVDVFPKGNGVKIDNRFYRYDGTLIRTIQAGHGGWARGTDGTQWFISQHNSAGWIAAYEPDLNEFMWLQRMPGEDGTLGIGGMHAASDKRGYFKGWALISTYGGGSTLADNVYFLELKSQKQPGTIHPSYGGSLTAWQANTVPNDDMPRIIRIAHMQNKWGGYFSEGFASVGADLNVYWGGNWNGTDNLELYRAELTQDILKAAGVVPEYPQIHLVTGPATFTTELPAGEFLITVNEQ